MRPSSSPSARRPSGPRGLPFAFALLFPVSLPLGAAGLAHADSDPSDPPAEVKPAPRPGPRKNPRVMCGCPSPRLLGRGPAILDAAGTVTAWLHDGARLEVFAQDAVNKQKLSAVDAPIVVEEFHAFGDGDPVGTTSRLVRARATAPLAPGTYLGVLRKSDVAPRDVVAVTGEGGRAIPPPSQPPVLSALWLQPLEERERPGCGAWLTHMIAFELADGSPPPEAFLVSDQKSGAVALVDARFAGAFGLGEVEVCEQGLPFSGGAPAELEVRPVSATFGVGEAWRFSSDGTGMTDLVRRASPASADQKRILEPFPIPGADDRRGPTTKEVAAAVMGGAAGGAVVFALLFWVVIPARRRRLKEIRCPACHKAIPIDTLDPKSDGFFCPACGAAGFWKGEARALPDVPPAA
jgi:hypothetical protein